jgi:hypothetical protein
MFDDGLLGSRQERQIMIALSVGGEHDHWDKTLIGGGQRAACMLLIGIPKMVLLPPAGVGLVALHC